MRLRIQKAQHSAKSQPSRKEPGMGKIPVGSGEASVFTGCIQPGRCGVCKEQQAGKPRMDGGPIWISPRQARGTQGTSAGNAPPDGAPLCALVPFAVSISCETTHPSLSEAQTGDFPCKTRGFMAPPVDYCARLSHRGARRNHHRERLPHCGMRCNPLAIPAFPVLKPRRTRRARRKRPSVSSVLSVVKMAGPISNRDARLSASSVVLPDMGPR